MARSFAFAFACLALCAASVRSFAVRTIETVASVAMLVVEFIGSPFASNPRLAFDGPTAPRSLGNSWLAPLVDRHEAGVSRRSAARNV